MQQERKHSKRETAMQKDFFARHYVSKEFALSSGRVWVKSLNVMGDDSCGVFCGEMCVFVSGQLGHDLYEDDTFLASLREYLASQGFSKDATSAVDFSEQGMQEDHFVSLDIRADFIDEMRDLFDVVTS